MEINGIVPDVIDVAPEHVCEITYPNGVKVDFGNTLKPTDVKDAPTVRWNPEKNLLYTLCMIDPDAPSRKAPRFREWHHWLVGNIPAGDINNGEVLSAYIGSGPPRGTGLHRYIFLIYKQKGKITFNEVRLKNDSGNGRCNFSIRKFAQRYKLGQPISYNYFQAEWDDYVPILNEQLGSKKKN